MTPSLSQPTAMTLHSDDPDEIAGALIGGQFEYLPVPGAPYSGHLRRLCLGPMVLQSVADGPHIARGAFSPGLSGFLLPLHIRGELPVTVNGVERAHANALLVPSGAELRALAPTRIDWVATAMPSTVLEELTELAPMSTRSPLGVSLVEATPKRMQRLSAGLEAAMEMVDRLPPALMNPGTTLALSASLSEMIQVTLTPGFSILAQRRATREAVRVVRKAEDFLEAHIERPIFRDELCAAIGVSRRKLHDAFVATVGLTPPAYLKLRRLVMVRRLLRSANARPALIKSVALAHGFWHLGYFAQDYRALFGELPSETMPRRRRDLPATIASRDSAARVMASLDLDVGD